MKLKDRRILLGVTGGIAAYKSAMLASLLVKEGAIVDVIMTDAATKFITELTFTSITRRDVHTKMFGSYESKPSHISLAENAELIIVAPATGNTIAKVTHGIADNLLTGSILASPAKLLFAPAMNNFMWDNPATQENIKIMQERGANFIGPEVGVLACGTTGIGRMSEPEDILQKAISLF